MSPALVALLGLATVIISTLGGYLGGRRTTSGEVDTSKAEELWKESSDIRRELAAQATYWQNQWQIVQTKLDECLNSKRNEGRQT